MLFSLFSQQLQQSLILNYPQIEMRNSNSRGNSFPNSIDKPSTSAYSQNRLMKTQLPPKTNPKQSLNSTQYRLPPSTPTIKRIDSTKSSNSTGNQVPKQEINYDIHNNMTESKVITAKESLQLLKKKMNRTGMSRQKPSNTPQSNQNIQPMQKTSYAPDSMKKIKPESNKNIDNYQPVSTKNSQASKNYEQQQSYNSKDNYQPQSYKQPVKKPIQQQKPSLKKTPSITENYRNEAEQIPIVRKQTFEEMIERQLRKQQQMKGNSGNNAPKNQQNFDPQEYPEEDGELFECSKGCGRQFNGNAISKHEKVCEKVFQSKRKAFNTAAQRQVENEGNFQKMPQQSLNQTKKPVEKKTKIPKWKLQSAQLRAGLKADGNVPLTAQQEAMNNMQKDSMVQCSFCGRKFSQEAAKRHIPFCEKKNKQMPRPSNPKKK